MRTEVGVHAALILVGALAFGLALVECRSGQPDRVLSLAWVALAGSAFVLTRRAVVHARDDEEQHAAAPRTTLRLCAVGIAAWAVLLLLVVYVHGRLPQPVMTALGFLSLFLVNAFAVPLFLLFAVEFGILAVGKARSRTAKWVVALVHFTPPLGYAALLLT